MIREDEKAMAVWQTACKIVLCFWKDWWTPGTTRKRFSWWCSLCSMNEWSGAEIRFYWTGRKKIEKLPASTTNLWFVVPRPIFLLLIVWTMEPNLCFSCILTARIVVSRLKSQMWFLRALDSAMCHSACLSVCSSGNQSSCEEKGRAYL